MGQSAGTRALTEKAIELFEPQLAAEVVKQIHDKQIASEGVESPLTLGLADSFYDGLSCGRIEGLPTVTWNGMDLFIFQPVPQRPFRYVTSTGRVIEPRLMDDGGSTPRLLHSLSKFSPWSYGPAFVVHDWLFTAKKCGYQPDNNMTLEKTGKVMAEIMKTMMEVGYTDYDGKTVKVEKAEDTLYVMHEAVISIFARRLWDDTTSVRCLSEANV